MPNKLGFYLHSFEIGEYKPDLFRAIQQIRPPVMLVHAWDQVDQLRRLSPDSLIIGRMTYFGPDRRPVNELAEAWLDSDDPEARGREFAEHILRDNFNMATRRENGRLLVDAWMSLNEAVPGPASDQYRQKTAETERRLRAYDAFQAGFRSKLVEQGIEAVAFNFGAGNFGSAGHYADFFPRTLADYTYLGFHEYGWPALSAEVDPAAVSSAGSYRAIVSELSRRTGRRYEAVLTEAGLALMYKHPKSWDKGWLFTPPPELGAESVTQEQYWQSLDWLNRCLLHDDFARGACLFEVGHAGDWDTFRHFGRDNAGQEIQIIPRIAQLASSGAAAAAPAPSAQVERPAVTLRGRIAGSGGAPVAGAAVRIVAGADLLGADPHAVANNRGAVTWTRRIHGFSGSLWNCWQKHVARSVAGITWEEFRREVWFKNPHLRESEGILLPGESYYVPENRVYADTASAAPVVAWDRMLADFEGSLWDCWQRCVQGKVVGVTWPQFRAGVLAENPSLAADKERFAAYKIYRLPRNVGAEEYVRVDYTAGEGRFAFAGLQPGVYCLEVSADGYRRHVAAVTVEGAAIECVLEPLVPAAAAGPLPAAAPSASPFIGVVGRSLVLGGRTFRFVGVNLRGLAHYGTPVLPYASKDQQTQQLQAAHEAGARVVRIFLPDKNASVDEIIGRLQNLIDLMDRSFADMYLIVALTNLYGDVPFHVPGDDVYYRNNILQPEWFHGGGSDNYRSFLTSVIPRFQDTPRILAYNIGNELKAQDAPELLVEFMHAAAQRIRELDGGRHLVTTGMISTRHAFMQGRNDLRRRLYDTDLLHFITNHAYHGDDNDATSTEQDNETPSREDDSDLAERLVKPLVIEEAGFVGTGDRTRWFANEMQRLLENKLAAGYMPWGFMRGSDNGDGNDKVGIDERWHGADWNSVCGLLRSWGERLQAAAADIQAAGPAFSIGQTVCTTVQVKLRPAAGFSGAPESIILLAPGTQATVRAACMDKDGLTWWPVRARLEGGQEAAGWIAQAAPDGTTLLVGV